MFLSNKLKRNTCKVQAAIQVVKDANKITDQVWAITSTFKCQFLKFASSLQEDSTGVAF